MGSSYVQLSACGPLPGSKVHFTNMLHHWNSQNFPNGPPINGCSTGDSLQAPSHSTSKTHTETFTYLQQLRLILMLLCDYSTCIVSIINLVSFLMTITQRGWFLAINIFKPFETSIPCRWVCLSSNGTLVHPPLNSIAKIDTSTATVYDWKI